jgi:type II secretory pathway pseudopilin PulG
MHAPCLAHPRSHGLTLFEALASLALLTALLVSAIPTLSALRGRSAILQARAQFEADWQWARWHALRAAQTLRLQAIAPCPRQTTGNSLNCGWQWVALDQGQVFQASPLPVGLNVSFKPADGWRVDAWGEPLGGGASVLFQSTLAPGLVPQTLCLNVLGRLRRVQGEACSD